MTLADSVPMARQLFHHADAEDPFLGSVMEDVHTSEDKKDVANEIGQGTLAPYLSRW